MIKPLATTALALGLAACVVQSPAPSAPAPAPGTPPVATPPGTPPTPPTAELPPFPEEPFRAERPTPSAERPFTPPAVRRFKLAQAVEVFLVEDHDLPVVSIDLNLEGGAAGDPAGKVGLANICMAMLTEGTARLDKVAYGEAQADLASTISSYAGDDRQGVAMNTLKRNLAPTFALWSETLRTPGWRQVDFDRMIQRSLEALKQAKASPGALANRLGDGVLYGIAHPLGQVATEASLAAITLDDCKRYHAEQVKPGKAQLYVVGDVTEADVRGMFGPLLASWSGAPKAVARVPRVADTRPAIYFVHVPGAAQSSVLMTHLGPRRKAPTYFANQMMAQLLGGGFASRINMNLREDKGYAYGARAGFAYNRTFGAFTATSSVRTDATAQTLIEMVRETTGLKDGSMPARDAELAREKNGAILGLPGIFATASDTLAAYRGLVYFGLPLDYYASYAAKVGAVDLKAAAKAAKRELRPERARFLVVGDGDAPQIQHVAESKTNPPMYGPGSDQPLTLRQALALLAESGALGGTKLRVVELDADGRPRT